MAKEKKICHKPLAYGIRQPELRKIASGSPYLDVDDVKLIIHKVLSETLALVIKDILRWIVRFVPKMTGNLRLDLRDNVMDSNIRNSILRIYICTTVNYAKYVVYMTTKQVRHKGKKIKHRGSVLTLHDPQAIGNFFETMVKYAIKSILYNLTKMKQKYARKTKLKFSEMKIVKL